jgi:hypothetical protein
MVVDEDWNRLMVPKSEVVCLDAQNLPLASLRRPGLAILGATRNIVTHPI